MHVVHVLERVRVVREYVRAVGVSRALVQVVVLLHQLLQLALHVGDFLVRELVLVQRHLGALEVFQKRELLGDEEQQRAPAPVRAARGPPDAVDVLARVVGGVELDDPVHRGDIQTARGDIRAEQNAAIRLAKLEKRRRSSLLLLLSVDVAHRDVDVVEQLGVVLHGVARGEEHHDLLLQVLLQEREEEQEALLRGHDAVPLLDASRRRHRARVVDADVRRALQREPREVLHLRGLRRGEKHGLSVLGDHAHDRAHLLLEPDVQHAVRLVHAKNLERRKREPFRVLHVVQQTAGRRHEQVHALHELLRLHAAVSAADNQPVRLRMFLGELLRDVVNLERQLASRREHHHARAVARHELGVVQELHGGDEERQGLARARARGAQDVASREQGRDGARLNLGHLRVPQLGDAGHGVLRQTERVEGFVAEDAVHLHGDALALRGQGIVFGARLDLALLLSGLRLAVAVLAVARLARAVFVVVGVFRGSGGRRRRSLFRQLPLLDAHARAVILRLLALALLDGGLHLLLPGAERLELLRGHARRAHGDGFAGVLRAPTNVRASAEKSADKHKLVRDWPETGTDATSRKAAAAENWVWPAPR